MGSTPPLALALVIADAIWMDPGTGKKTIIGTFSAIYGREFPLPLGSLGIYVALTDARGKIALQLRLIDVDELQDAPVWKQDFPVEFEDPTSILELQINTSEVVFPASGEYRLQLFADGELIIERRIVVMPAIKDTP
jgi:hypothetical protein